MRCRFLTDEDFNGRIVRGLRLREPTIDMIRVQDIGLSGADDRTILQRADDDGRVLLTHDARTIPGLVSKQLSSGGHTPGVFVVDDSHIGKCIEDLLLVTECSEADEWENRIFYLPFR